MQTNKTQSPNFGAMYRIKGSMGEFLKITTKMDAIFDKNGKIKPPEQFKLFDSGYDQICLFCTEKEAGKLLHYNEETYKHVVGEEEYNKSNLDFAMGINCDRFLDYKLALRKFFDENFKKYLPDYDKSPEFEAKDILKSLEEDKFDVKNGKML
jgi:hypothetical protein